MFETAKSKRGIDVRAAPVKHAVAAVSLLEKPDSSIPT